MDLGMPTLIEHENLSQSAELCNELGLDFVELNMNLPQYQISELRSLDFAKYRGVYFTLHLDENLNPFDFNPEVAAAWRNTALDAVRIARNAGMPIVNMHMPMGVHFSLPGERVYLFDQYWQETSENVRRFTDAVDNESRGKVLVCIENTVFMGFRHLPAAVDALLESPAFGLTYDCGHDSCDGFRALPFYKARADRLLHFHLHDAKDGSAHLPLGEGDIDISAMLHMAQNCRVVLETKDGPGLRKSAGYLRNIIQDI